VFFRPSPRKNDSSATVRVPRAALVISSAPPSARIIGAESEETAATQRVPPGTTWHSVPVRLRQ
jgi:hypothetical protein